MNAPLPPVDRYVYLLGDLPFLILWLGVYCCRKDLRRPLWIMSLFTTAGSLTGPFFREDYFHPRRIWDLDGLGLEDVIFCFTVGGSSSPSTRYWPDGTFIMVPVLVRPCACFPFLFATRRPFFS